MQNSFNFNPIRDTLKFPCPIMKTSALRTAKPEIINWKSNQYLSFGWSLTLKIEKKCEI